MKTYTEKDFYVECAVCHQLLKNHVGSTPCCGSIAYMVDENGKTTNAFVLFGSINGNDIEPLKINNEKV